MALYGLALAHFDWRQVRTGAGDHWVAGGALSISALAAAKLTDACDPRGPLGWATVFPLGMTAVACLVVAATAGLPVAGTLGRVLLWIAVALWLLTAVGAARQGRGR
ncbi:hypothetical protein [Streptomyces sp. NPDC051662]|uniref:hypothetical protein n=1 Tax=Streptomyces sp. NPDC051662 TaxID=3154750 RepID=UPI00342485F4